MNKFQKFFAAIMVAIIASFSFATPALADGFSSRELRLTIEEKRVNLLAGEPVYFGDRRSGEYMMWNPLTRILTTYTFIRAHGHQENSLITTRYCTDDVANPLPQNECGALAQPLIVNATSTTNGNATFGRALASVLPAATNGIGTAAVSSIFSPCRNGGCNSGGGSQVYNIVEGATAVAGSESNAAVGTEIDISGLPAGCGTSTCGSGDTSHPGEGYGG